MTKTTLRSIRHFYPGSLIKGICTFIAFSFINCFDEWTFSSRLFLSYYFIIWASRIFLKAWKDNRPTRHSLMDALLVPYKKKEHNQIQFILLIISFYSIFSCMNICYLISHQSIHLFFPVMYRMMILGGIFLASVILSHYVIQKKYQIMLNVIAVFYGLIHSFSYQLEFNQFFDGYRPSGFILGSLIAIACIVWLDQDDSPSKKLHIPAVSKNTRGILTLSKMPIIKDTPINGAFGFGISSYTIFYMVRGLFRAIERIERNQGLTYFNWTNVFWILLFITLISSVHSLKTIYISKSMLRIVPVRKAQLFNAAVFKALWLPVMTQVLCAGILWITQHEYPVSAFFLSEHPYEILLNGLYLAIVPSSVYLICFSVYASENRFASVFLIIAACILGSISFAVSSLILMDLMPGKIIILILLTIVPHIMAFYLHYKMQNIHS